MGKFGWIGQIGRRFELPQAIWVNYRRVLEIQTRLLARVVTGEAPRYVGFETR
ncbi:MAG: hypothetical protein WBQ86_19905 [Candidatus Binatus sp.]